MQRQIGYNDEGSRRVAKATRWVENHKRTHPITQKNDVGLGDWKFFAEITGQDTEDKRKYSWNMLSFQDLTVSTDVLAENAGYLQGHWDWQEESEAENNYLPYAVDIHGSESVVIGDIVEMFPSPDQEYFFFDYRPGKKLAIMTTTITASDGTAAGSGTANIASFDGTNISDTEGEVAVYNNMVGDDVAFVSGKQIHIAYFPKDKAWFIDVEGCS